MEESEQNGEEQSQPPHDLFERLSYLNGYTWDQSIKPFHSVRLPTHELSTCLCMDIVDHADRAMIIGMYSASSMRMQIDPPAR